MTVQELLKKSWSLRRNVVDIIMAGGGGHIGGDMSVLNAQGISATVLDMYCVKPLDSAAVIRASQNAYSQGKTENMRFFTIFTPCG